MDTEINQSVGGTNRGTLEAAAADSHPHIAVGWCGTLPVAVRPHRSLRISLLRAVLREIRSLISRIAEIRDRQLDLQGVSVDPCQEQSFPPELRESALARCIADTRNLYKSRPATTLIDAELFVQGWKLGIAWGCHNLRKQPPA